MYPDPNGPCLIGLLDPDPIWITGWNSESSLNLSKILKN